MHCAECHFGESTSRYIQTIYIVVNIFNSDCACHRCDTQDIYAVLIN